MVVGIDLIPAQPPRGVSTIQGNFLSPAVRNLVKTFVAEGAARKQMQQQSSAIARDAAAGDSSEQHRPQSEGGGEEEAFAPEASEGEVVVVQQTSYIDAERLAARDAVAGNDEVEDDNATEQKSAKEERLVDVSLQLMPVQSSPVVCRRSPILTKVFTQS